MQGTQHPPSGNFAPAGQPMYANSIPSNQQAYPQQGGVYPSGYPSGEGYYPPAPNQSGYLPEAGAYMTPLVGFSPNAPPVYYDASPLPPKT